MITFHLYPVAGFLIVFIIGAGYVGWFVEYMLYKNLKRGAKDFMEATKKFEDEVTAEAQRLKYIMSIKE